MDQLRVTLRRIALRHGYGRWLQNVVLETDEHAAELVPGQVLVTNGGAGADPDATQGVKRRRLARQLVQLCGGDVSVTLRTMAAARRVLAVEQERHSQQQS